MRLKEPRLSDLICAWMKRDKGKWKMERGDAPLFLCHGAPKFQSYDLGCVRIYHVLPRFTDRPLVLTRQYLLQLFPGYSLFFDDYD